MKERKNILYFTRTMNLGGTEKVVLQLCEIMKSEADKIVVCSCGGVNVENLNKMNIKHYNIPDIDKKDIRTILTVLKKISMIIKEENINIVHTHHRMAAFYTRIIGFTRNFIFINNSHNTFYDKKLLTKFSLGKANIVAVGNKVKDNLCDFYGISKFNIEVIHNAVEPFEDQIEPIEILKKYKRDGYALVGNIGRISEQKGMEYFVRTIPLVLEKYKKTKFFIIGDGEDKGKIKTLISELHVEDYVVLLGYRNDIQNVMSQLDLIVLSSLWEGLPLTPIEAFSVAKPIVATAVDGTVEIIDDDVNGILVGPKDIKELADAIISIFKFPERTEMFKINALKKYNEEFSYEILKDRYIKYYKRLME
ncbi:hypothetical protein CBE01nite_33170 [Clostridium beijerinckii]|nr:glycosyltransferase [Clostridium beijerinckii]NYB98108.1 glycosyltransferase involved in cell wall biosynthesis [Clostridium beijerinckii]OOM23276.1 alpha-D-kanosaminyltransferase [Clostridium beijerinckii]GEP65549.1 hypothetical protein CBE01nite_33170 [Clostridium beijerinckii]SQB12944.1 hexosyltransferase [Clostridium beijerinckii]